MDESDIYDGLVDLCNMYHYPIPNSQNCRKGWISNGNDEQSIQETEEKEK